MSKILEKIQNEVVVKVVFETSDLEPQHAWDCGTVQVMTIARSSELIEFEGFSEIPSKIETALLESGVTLHHGLSTVNLYARREDDS